MLIVRATKKLLRLAGPSTVPDDDRGTTLLGPWYATVLFWRPRVVLLVNEATLERRHMRTVGLGVTANRSVVGVMIEFARLAEIHHHDDPAVDLVELAVRLAATPCSPLYGRNVSPDRELAATVQAITT